MTLSGDLDWLFVGERLASVFFNLFSHVGYVQQKRIFQSPGKWSSSQHSGSQVREEIDVFSTQQLIRIQAYNLSVFGMIIIYISSIIPNVLQFRGLLLYLLLRINYYIQVGKGQLPHNVQSQWGYGDLHQWNSFPPHLVLATWIFQPPLYTNCSGIWCCQLSICFPESELCCSFVFLYSSSCGFMPFKENFFTQVLVEFFSGAKLGVSFSLPS